jgi:hypothetical protein
MCTYCVLLHVRMFALLHSPADIHPHRDAPAMSNEPMQVMDVDHHSTTAESSTTAAWEAAGGGGEGWDDEALAASLVKSAPRASGHATTELLDMNSLSLKRREEDDVAERMRVEDTRAQLAAAKAGMEREAARLAAAAASDAKPKSAGPAGMNKSWVAPHLRSGGTTTSTRTGFGTRLDTQSEELFPDLHMAEAILEKQQQQQQITKALAANSKVTAGGVGAGATWGGARPTLQLKKVPKKPPMEARPKEDDALAAAVREERGNPTPAVPAATISEDVPPLVEETPTALTEPAVLETGTPPGTAEPPAVPKKKPVLKKKKKDLSTFKPSSS